MSNFRSSPGKSLILPAALLFLQACDSASTSVPQPPALGTESSALASAALSFKEHNVVNASSPDDYDGDYHPSLTIDGDLDSDSRWSSQGTDQTLVLDLGTVEDVGGLLIAWYKGDSRTAYFDVDTSVNGSSWQSVLSGGTGSGSGLQPVSLQASSAQYVRIIGRGNSSSDWNSILEVKVTTDQVSTPAPQSCNDMDNLTIESATSSDSYDQAYSPVLAIDDNLGTDSRWSSNGDGNSITFDLGQTSTVRRLATAWYKANTRTAFFDVETSLDNSNWQLVKVMASVQGTQGMVNIDVDESEARYVKIVGRGNSESAWNSLIEAEVYGCGNVDNASPAVPPVTVPPVTVPPVTPPTTPPTAPPTTPPTSPTPSGNGNIVFNGTFENSLSGWAQVEPATGSGDSYEGAGAGKVSSSGALSQDVFLVPGSQYSFSAWIQGNPTIGIDVGGQTYSVSGSGTDSSYSLVTFEFASGNSDTGRVFLQASSSSDSQRADNIEVIKISGNSGTTVNPNTVFDFSIWDVEGESPITRDGNLQYDALEQCVITPNGNGCRHEQKIRESERYGLTEQYERFAADIQPFLSDGSETIVAQHHPQATGTLSALYVTDREDPWPDVDNGVASDGIFDLVATIRKPGSTSNNSVVFGTIKSGQSFRYEVINDHGVLTMTALGKTYTVTSADSSASYFKFGNYQQAREPVSGERIDLPKPHGDDARAKFLDYYDDLGLTQSSVVFRNVEYFRSID